MSDMRRWHGGRRGSPPPARQPKPGERTSAPAEVSCGQLFCSSCVECKAFESGPFAKNCTQACPNIRTAEESTEESKQCKEKDSNNCWISFRMVQDDGEEMYTVIVDSNKGTPALLLLPCCGQAAGSPVVVSPGAAAGCCLSVLQSARSLPTLHLSWEAQLLVWPSLAWCSC